MPELHIIGVSHQYTKLELREMVMFGPNLITEAYESIKKNCKVEEVVLLSTCARTECILKTDNIENVRAWFAEFHKIEKESLNKNLKHLKGEDAIKHLIRLASGIDSFVPGETQVLGQLKKAFATAEKHGAVANLFYQLFPAVFKAAKEIRSKTNICSSQVSLPATILRIAKQNFNDLSQCKVMLIGAGEMIHKTATYLYDHGIRSWIVANRTLEKAKDVTSVFAGQEIVIEEIAKNLDKVDIVVSATASPVPILGTGLIERIQKKRGNKTLLLADLAMPRDIEAEAGQIPGVILRNLDNLQAITRNNVETRSLAAKAAMPMIERACAEFIKNQNSRQHVTVIRDFRDHVHKLQKKAKEEAMNKIKAGKKPEQVLDEVLMNLTNQLMHSPTINLRAAARDKNHDILRCAREIFSLEKQES